MISVPDPRKYGSRQAWREAMKGEEYAGWSTAGELAAMLGITPKYLNQLVKRGRLPAADGRCSNGWKVWSPEAARNVLNVQKRRKGLV